MDGFWTARARPASMDWCEPNYVHSHYVAEWWNTLSSVPISLAALLGFWLLWRSAAPREPRFVLGYVVVFVVGLGSVAFHATLSKLGQALDELPMVWAGLVFVYTVRFRSSARPPSGVERAALRRWRLGLALYAASFTAAYVALPSYFSFFILTYGALIAYLVVRTALVSFKEAPRADRKRWFGLAAGSYVGGVLLLWIPENVVFACDHPIQGLHLHAWFHLSSALGSFAWLGWAVRDRLSPAESRSASPLIGPGPSEGRPPLSRD